MTRYCIECGAPLKEGASFCTNCGAPVYEETDAEPTCPHCGAPLDPGAAFCVECGAPVNSTATMVMPAVDAQDAARAPQGMPSVPAAKKNMAPYAIGAAIAAVGVAIALVLIINPFGWELGPHKDGAEGQSTQQESKVAGSGSADAADSDDADAADSSADEQGDATDAGDSAAESEQPTISVAPEVDHNTGVNRASESDDYYVLPESSTRVYAASELSGLSDWDLKVARNEIFARHGRGFKDSALQEYFNSKSWYQQIYTPDEYDAMPDQLSETEHANIDVIKSLEPESNFQ